MQRCKFKEEKERFSKNGRDTFCYEDKILRDHNLHDEKFLGASFDIKGNPLTFSKRSGLGSAANWVTNKRIFLGLLFNL